MKRFFAKNKTHIIVLLSYFLLNVLIFYPIFLGRINLNGHMLVSFFSLFGENVSYKSIGWDQIRVFYPYIAFNLESIKNFSLPYWNPFMFSGVPYLANPQTSFFYPLSFLGFFLSPQSYWNLMRFSPYFLGAFFTYVYLNQLKLQRIASFFGGLTFGFSLLMLAWGEEIVHFPHSIIWFPLMLFFIEKYKETKDKKFLGLLILVTSISIMAGFIQTTLYIFIFLAFYIIFRFGYKSLVKSKVGLNFLIAFIASILICAIQIFPSFQLYLNSAREVYDPAKLANFLNPPQALLSYLAPDIFGNPATGNFYHPGNSSYYESTYFVGIAAMLFVLIAFFSARKKGPLKFFSWAFLISIIFSLNFAFSKLQVYLNIPFLSSAIPNRLLFIPTFSLSVLSAYGVNIYLEKKENNLAKIFLIIFAIYIFLFLDFAIIYKFKMVSFNSDFQHALTSLRNLITPFIIFVISSLLLFSGSRVPRLKNITLKATIVIALLFNIYLAHKFFSFSENKFIYPQKGIFTFLEENQGAYRTLNMTNDRLLNNILMQYRIYTPEGYDPANIKSYLEFMSLVNGNKNLGYARTVAEVKFSEDPEKIVTDEPRKKLVNLLGVKYFIVEKEKVPVFKNRNYKVVFSEEREKGFAVLENPDVSKRAFLTSDFESYPNKSDKIVINNYTQAALDITDKLLSPDFDPQNKIIIESNSQVLTGKSTEGAADITSYKPNEVVINTKSESPKLLFLSDSYYPGWKATVDGKGTEILRADYTFRAVSLPAGSHIVRFYFDSDLNKIGKYISLLSLLVVLLFYFVNFNSLTLKRK